MKDEARKQFDKVISGKTLEANPAGRKGKYSLEVARVLLPILSVLSHSFPVLQ